MILPTKHLEVEKSLLAVGGTILPRLSRPRTVTSLWEDVRKGTETLTFERFTLALSFLYAIGTVEMQNDQLQRLRQ